MRAVCLLLCLALARNVAGSIFRTQSYSQMAIDQPLVQQGQQEQLGQQGPPIQPQRFQRLSGSRSDSKSSESSQESGEQHRRGRMQTQPWPIQGQQSSQSSSEEKMIYPDVKSVLKAPVGNGDYKYAESLPGVKLDPSSPPSVYALLAVDEIKAESKPLHGDKIVWKGVEMALGPKSPVKDKKDIENIYKDAYKTIQHLDEEGKKKLHEAYEKGLKADNEDARLNATELLKKYKYDAEVYDVKTEDGYYLTLYRMLPKKGPRDTQKKPIVFLMHGLLGSADDWLLMGPGKSLAYLLADAGYEVYLGNARGNKYCRRHASKHNANPDFWKYSTDEIALHDLPAMIDYALKKSEQDKLYYVGHALGTTAFFALAASRPEYNDKTLMMYALSPMAYMGHARSPLMRMVAPNSPFHNLLKEALGDDEIKPSKEVIHTVGGEFCEKETGCMNICSNINYVMSGFNPKELDAEFAPVIMGHLPAGGSTRQIMHYGQGVASHEFRKYDYGRKTNEKVYGDQKPPCYDVKKIRVPVALYYSEDDWLSHPKDVAKLHKDLPTVKDLYKVADEHFGHMDFQFSKKAPEIIYKRLIESIKQNRS